MSWLDLGHLQLAHMLLRQSWAAIKPGHFWHLLHVAGALLLVVTLSGIAISGKTEVVVSPLLVVPTEVEHSLFKRPTSAAGFLITLTGCDVEETEAEGICMAMAAIIMLLPDKVYS